MKNSTWAHMLIFGALGLIDPACTSLVYRDVYPALLDGKYDSEFPYRGCSEQLQQIGESVQMLNCIAYYRSYVFPQESRTRVPDIDGTTIEKRASKIVYFRNSAAGSATVISYQRKAVLLLTCAHILSFPDTLVSYYPAEGGKRGEYVQSVSVKERQSNYVAVFPEGGEVDILAMDRSLDVAALGKKFRLELPRSIAVFDYPLGRARELEWGSFVYVFGYPMGNKMVTKGTVSSPNKDKHGSFLMDAVFNRGFSGGVVVAIRDGVPNFELVGMVKLVSASSEYVLAPSEESGAVGYDPREPYTGTIHAVNKLTINYGITQAISVEAITGFLRAEQTLIERNGYSLGRFGALQPDVQ